MSKIIIFVPLFLAGFCMQASTLDCRGTWEKTEIYFSSNPRAPYDRYVRKRCGYTIPYVGDYYLVFEPYFNQLDLVMDNCNGVPGRLEALQTRQQGITTDEINLDLEMCNEGQGPCKGKPGIALKVSKKTGAAVISILENGRHFTPGTLKCKVQ